MTTEAIITDSVARAAAAAALVKGQIDTPALTIDDTYSIALGIGLTIYEGGAARTRILVGTTYRPLAAADFVTTAGATMQNTNVEVSAEAAARVTAIAGVWSVTEAVVRSKALCTGCAFLNGTEAYVGPFA